MRLETHDPSAIFAPVGPYTHGLEVVEARARGTHTPELSELWAVMTEVRRSEPGAEW